MGLINAIHNKPVFRQWHTIKLPLNSSSSDACIRLVGLYGLRVAVLAVMTGLWVVLTLSTGLFTVGMVILLGGGIGIAHLLLPCKLQRPHLPSALALTLLGGVFANVLAGLAFFSSKAGVSYWQVLGARQFPQDFKMLGGVFLESFYPQDLLYYLFAMVAVSYLVQRRYVRTPALTKAIQVELDNGTFCLVDAQELATLLMQKHVVRFLRSDGWAVVGQACLRRLTPSNNYDGPERRSLT